MIYFKTVDGYEEDALIGGDHVPIIIENVSLAANASVQRGDLVCADSTGAYTPVTAEADASKPLAIIVGQCDADSAGGVAQVYTSGVFNSEKVLVGGADSLTAEFFREALRKDNIHLTSLKEY